MLDRRGRHITRQIVKTDSIGATAQLGLVACAGHIAACEADRRVGLQTVTAETLFPEFQPGETVVVGAAAAERLAG